MGLVNYARECSSGSREHSGAVRRDLSPNPKRASLTAAPVIRWIRGRVQRDTFVHPFSWAIDDVAVRWRAESMPNKTRRSLGKRPKAPAEARMGVTDTGAAMEFASVARVRE